MTIPFNRVVAFVAPFITLISASVAAWLVAKVDVLGLPHMDQGNTQTYIAAGLTFAVTAGLHALGSWQWLKGHHIQLAKAATPFYASTLGNVNVTSSTSGTTVSQTPEPSEAIEDITLPDDAPDPVYPPEDTHA